MYYMTELLPTIKRAREYHLYPLNGNRILDMYLDDGRALCGHRPAGLSVRMKQVLSLGLHAPYPHVWQKRLEKHLLDYFQGFSRAFFYRESGSLMQALKEKPADPLFEESGNINLWRPFIPVSDACDILVLRFPLPGMSDKIVLVKKDVTTEGFLPESDILTPVEAASAVKALAIWRSFEQNTDLNDYTFPSIGLWHERKPYLIPRASQEEYKSFSNEIKVQGLFIYPSIHIPAVIPKIYDKGEIKFLAKRGVEL